MTSVRAKILMVGSMRSGKSTVSNILADNEDDSSSAYRPTQALRILEFDRNLTKYGAPREFSKITVELWDVSGDQSFERCWPAIQDKAIGIMLLNNPETPGDLEELENLWYPKFVDKIGLGPNQCLILNNRVGYEGKDSFKPVKTFGKLARLNNIDVVINNKLQLQEQIDKFLLQVLKIASAQQGKDEDSIFIN